LDKVDVVGLGSCAVDYFAIVPKILSAEEKVNVQNLEIRPGGVTANNLTQIARLGIKAGWFGKIGDDDNGRLLLRQFEEDEIDTSHIMIMKDKRSSFTWIPLDPTGSRAIYMFPNVTAEITPEEIDDLHKDYIEGARALHTEASQLPLKPVLRACEIAKEADVTILFDLDVSPTYFVDVARLGTKKELMTAIHLADILAPCKDAAREITGRTDPVEMAEKLLSKGPKVVAITIGESGCVLATVDQSVKVPGYRVEVVDTTGAGDAFHGGLSYGFLKGWDLEEIGKFANACAALCCTKVGARAMSRLDEVITFMRENEPSEN